LVLLSDIDGLYDRAAGAAGPRCEIPAGGRSHHARKSRRWPGAAASELSRGGMRTKLDAGKIATSGRNGDDHHLRRSGRIRLPPSSAGERFTTWFKAEPDAGEAAYKSWIAGQLEPAGRLTVDAGAVRALVSGKIAAAGGRQARFSGQFSRGDTVAVLDRPQAA
jgi:glutamate 5-kinase